MPLIEAIIIGLAAWRVTALMAYERGPADVFLRFRECLGFEHGDDGEPNVWPEDWRLIFGCTWCLGLWVALASWAVWEYLGPAPIVVLAAAAVLVGMERWCHGN